MIYLVGEIYSLLCSVFFCFCFYFQRLKQAGLRQTLPWKRFVPFLWFSRFSLKRRLLYLMSYGIIWACVFNHFAAVTKLLTWGWFQLGHKCIFLEIIDRWYFSSVPVKGERYKFCWRIGISKHEKLVSRRTI